MLRLGMMLLLVLPCISCTSDRLNTRSHQGMESPVPGVAHKDGSEPSPNAGRLVPESSLPAGWYMQGHTQIGAATGPTP